MEGVFVESKWKEYLLEGTTLGTPMLSAILIPMVFYIELDGIGYRMTLTPFYAEYLQY